MCCNYGNGEYSVSVIDPKNDDGTTNSTYVVLSGGAFNASESVSFGGECRSDTYPKVEAPPCIDIVLALTTDEYPFETNVTLVDLRTGDTYWDDFVFDMARENYELTQCVDPSGCYEVTINDIFGDGISGSGFTLTYDDDVVGSGSEFGFSAVYLVGDGCEGIDSQMTVVKKQVIHLIP
jgi:hypothetical protein